ncbi:MAG: 3,4-dehydroadipyl-CoA semialdehyde dehydrogenase [Myxococcota bacterium]|jgi:3,4-dehydroadipyl-CoA semialdehyde dehydrogenase
MTDVMKSWLENRWQSGNGKPSPLVNPSTGAEVAHASTAGLNFGAALEYARQHGGPALRSMTFAERGAMLAAASKAVHAHRAELIELAIQNGGNTRGDAKFDIDGGPGTMMYYAGVGKELGDRRYLLDGDAVQLTRSPRYVGRHILTPLTGAAVHINAFNFPAWGMLEKASVAWLAGMPVVTKPATSTALVAARVAEILVESEIFPPGAFSFIAGGAGDLLEHVALGDAVAFTGSSGVGRMVRTQPNIIANSVRVNIEADSLNAAVLGPDVSEDSDTWDLFLREACKEITQKAGQKCTALRRIFVPQSVIDQVSAALAERLSEIRVGDPSLREVRMGPLSSARQLEDVGRGVHRLLETCTSVLGDGGRGDLVGIEGQGGYFMSPVLLRAASSDAPAVHADEVFGPVATLVPYDGTPEQAAELVSLGNGGLAASVYSDDREFISTVVVLMAPWTGRICVGSARVAEYAPGHGAVLPQLMHGGPGRAGGGEELGGVRGLNFYLQRTAIQGSKPLLEKVLEV